MSVEWKKRSKLHDELVDRVALMLGPSFVYVREAHFAGRRVDLLATCGRFRIGFEIKASRSNFLAEVRHQTWKHAEVRMACTEFYFVLPEAVLVKHRFDMLKFVPKDCGLIMVPTVGDPEIMIRCKTHCPTAET